MTNPTNEIDARINYAEQLLCVHLFDELKSFIQEYTIRLHYDTGKFGEPEKSNKYFVFCAYKEKAIASQKNTDSKDRVQRNDYDDWFKNNIPKYRKFHGHKKKGPDVEDMDLLKAIVGFFQYLKNKEITPDLWITATKHVVNPISDIPDYKSESFERYINHICESLNISKTYEAGTKFSKIKDIVDKASFWNNTLFLAWSIRCAYTHGTTRPSTYGQQRECSRVFLYSSIMLYYYLMKHNSGSFPEGSLNTSLTVTVNREATINVKSDTTTYQPISTSQKKTDKTTYTISTFTIPRFTPIEVCTTTTVTVNDRTAQSTPREFNHLYWDVLMTVTYPDPKSDITRGNIVYDFKVNDSLLASATDEKQLEEIKKILNEQSEAIKGIITQTNSESLIKSIEDLKTSIGNASDLEGIKEAINNSDKELQNEIKKLSEQIETSKNEVIQKGDENTDKVIQKGEENTDKVIQKDDENTDKVIKKINKNKKLLIGTIIVAFVLLYWGFGGLSSLTRWSKEVCYNVFHSEYFANLAYDAGSESIAYKHATNLESEKKYTEAAEWYQKAITRYESIDSAQLSSEAAYQLAIMYMRGKGGSFDLSKSRDYALRASNEYGRGLYLYLLTRADDSPSFKKAVEEVKIYNHLNLECDDYATLAKALVQFADGSKSSIAVIDSLSKSSSVANLEATFERAMLAFVGKEDFMSPCISIGSYLLQDMADNHNYLPAQLAMGELWHRLDRIDLAIPYYSIAVFNHQCFEVAPTLLRLIQCVPSFELAPFGNKDEIETKLNEICSLKEQQGPHLNLLESIYLFEDSLYNSSLSRLSNAVKIAQKGNKYQIYNDDKSKIFIGLHIPDVDLDSLINDSITGKMRDAAKDYLLAVRYAKGYGVSAINMTLSDSLLESSAKKGFNDAIYSWAVKNYQKGDYLSAINLLYKIEKQDFTAAYLLHKILNSFDEKLGANYLKNAHPDLKKLYGIGYSNGIDGLLSQATDLEWLTLKYYELGSNEFLVSALFVLGNIYTRLSELDSEHNILHSELAISSFNLCGVIDNKCTAPIFALENLYHDRGLHTEAADAYLELCKRIFQNDEITLDHDLKNMVIAVLIERYPETVESLNEYLGYDITEQSKPIEINFDSMHKKLGGLNVLNLNLIDAYKY